MKIQEIFGTSLKVVRLKNLNAFKSEIEVWMKKGYIPEWKSFHKDEGFYIIFMARL